MLRLRIVQLFQLVVVIYKAARIWMPVTIMQGINAQIKKTQKRVVFAEEKMKIL